MDAATELLLPFGIKQGDVGGVRPREDGEAEKQKHEK
jgi:hypothetical protein